MGTLLLLKVGDEVNEAVGVVVTAPIGSFRINTGVNFTWDAPEASAATIVTSPEPVAGNVKVAYPDVSTPVLTT